MAKSNFFSPEIALSSKKNDWTTPINLFDILNNEFHFTVDLCASAENALCNKFYSIENSGLNARFSREIVFCNPPYGRKITSDFIKKRY